MTNTSVTLPKPAEDVVLWGRSIVKSYGNSPALRGVSLAALRGEVLAITGPSGSGKSTLLLCLAGILRPDAGEVRFANRRIDTDSEAVRSALRRREFGVLFQFGQLVPELTAQENAALPLLLSGVRRREAMTTARTWLARFGVAELAEQRPPQMSGGQAQRVAVARALVTEPEVLFADEPTGALDTLAGEQVLEQLTRVARESGTTVLLVTHDAKVAAYAEREIVIRDGMLEGEPDRPASSVGRYRSPLTPANPPDAALARPLPVIPDTAPGGFTRPIPPTSATAPGGFARPLHK